MKKILLTLGALGVGFLLCISAVAQLSSGGSVVDRTIKPHHEALNMQCVNCHKSTDITQYQPLVTADCLVCHGSAEKVAQRTDHFDAKVKGLNPHRSIHDRTDLDCYECHAEHKPSSLLCSTCHDNTNEWFKATP